MEVTEYIQQLTVCLVFPAERLPCLGYCSELKLSFVTVEGWGGGVRGGLLSVSVGNAISPWVKLLKELWSRVGGEATHEKMVRVK